MKEPTNEQRVEKLVEWVAQNIHQMQTEGISLLYPKWRELQHEIKDWYISKAKQILTNPEYPLGIIVGMEDREVAPKTFTISYPKWSKPAMVIPLSEYLQEV